MRMLDDNEKLLRSDVHPLALVESEHPMMECAVCELPVGEEMDGNIFCSKECQDKALDEALWENAINEAVAKHKRNAAEVDIFAQQFPGVVALPEPTMPICSCIHH